MKKLFTISEFAKLRGVNINSLRYYERIGVLKPIRVDAKTGYRYYSPDQLPILDVILLCIDFGIPLKELRSYVNEDEFIKNTELFETGKQIARERLQKAQMELNKIEYTLQYLNVNRQYSEQTGLYKRAIPERRIVTMDGITGELPDVRKIETASTKLYGYAQEQHLSPVFPAGLIIRCDGKNAVTKIFFEIMEKDKNDAFVEIIPSGTFLCHQIDLSSDIKLSDAIEAVYGENERTELVVSNMLLDKYQIGTKKSELQKRVTEQN